MAEPQKPPEPGPGGRKPDLGTHPLVAKLHPDPDAPRDLVVLIGYLGPSKERDRVRLYTDLGFRSYVEVRREDVVLAEPTDREDENSPTRVHVEATAKLEVVQTSSQSVEASYLKGSIASSYLGEAAGASATLQPFPTGAACTIGPICHVSLVVICGTNQVLCPLPTHATLCCPSHQVFCPSHQVFCPTSPKICVLATGVCPGYTPACPLFTPACPQFTPACPVPETPGCPFGPGGPGGPVQFAAAMAPAAAGPAAAPPLPQSFIACHTQAPICHPTVPIACHPTIVIHLCPTLPFHGCPPPTPLHGCPTNPLHGCPPPTPLHGCPTNPLHGCPPPTPLHGCPPITHATACPVISQCAICPTPPIGCGGHTHLLCPTSPLLCVHTAPIVCHVTVNPPCHTIVGCPVVTQAGCPPQQTLACGPGGLGGGGPIGPFG